MKTKALQISVYSLALALVMGGGWVVGRKQAAKADLEAGFHQALALVAPQDGAGRPALRLHEGRWAQQSRNRGGLSISGDLCAEQESRVVIACNLGGPTEDAALDSTYLSITPANLPEKPRSWVHLSAQTEQGQKILDLSTKSLDKGRISDTRDHMVFDKAGRLVTSERTLLQDGAAPEKQGATPQQDVDQAQAADQISRAMCQALVRVQGQDLLSFARK